MSSARTKAKRAFFGLSAIVFVELVLGSALMFRIGAALEKVRHKAQPAGLIESMWVGLIIVWVGHVLMCMLWAYVCYWSLWKVDEQNSTRITLETSPQSSAE